MSREDIDEAQLERARQSFELVIHDAPAERVARALRAVLRVKRFDMARVLARLPGVVRRGARVDLEPLADALAALGIDCEVRRTQREEPAP
jgi:hypothetical protein